MFYDRARTNARSASRFALLAKRPFVFVDFGLRRNQLIDRMALFVMIQQTIGNSIREIFSRLWISDVLLAQTK